MTLHRLPRETPPPDLLLRDLGSPTADDLARALGVSRRTIWRWRETDEWPRMACLALFFASRYGWSVVDSEARFAVDLARLTAQSQHEQIRRLQRQLEAIEALGLHGSANMPRLSAG